LKELIDIYNESLEIVIECGNILKNADYQKENNIKKDGSFVTKYDLQIDEILTERLKSIVNCSVLSEEHMENQLDNYFVVDPIDGTHNFNAGLELFGIMISYVQDEITQFSIVYLPLLDKLYTAIKGKGAFLNNKQIHVKNNNGKLIGACDINKKDLSIISSLLDEKCLNIEFRSLYCCAAELCYIADGTFDFYFCKNEGGIWDIIGPKLIIEEAGGILKYKKTDEGHYDVIAGTFEAIESIEIIKSIV
jgi:fructose-1,6-bisphosphatase/inositol monophosphatase family enzyme